MKKILLTGSNGLLGQKIVHNIISKRSNQYQLLATSKGDNRISNDEGYTYQTLDISDDLTIDLRYIHLDIDNGYDAFTLANTRKSFADEPGEDKQRTNAVGIKTNWNASDAVIIQTEATYLHSDLVYSYDEDWGNPRDRNDPASAIYDPLGIGYDSFDRYDRERENYSFELRALSDKAGRIFNDSTNWTVGLYHINQDVKFDRTYTYGDQDGAYNTQNTAVYGQLDTALTEKLTLVSGARTEYFKANYDDSNAVKENIHEVLFGGKVGLNYQANENHMVYTTLSRGYKPGGVSNDARLAKNQRVFDTEYNISLETGVKSSWMDDRLQTTLAAFYTERKNAQVKNSIFVGRWIDFTGNASNATHKGIEASMDWFVTDKLRLLGSLGLLDAKFDKRTFRGINFNGRQVAHAPDYTYSLGAEIYPSTAWTLRVNVEGKDKFYFSDSHNEQSSRYDIVNASADYRYNKNWKVSIWARNLFDKDYATRGFGFGNNPAKNYVEENPTITLEEFPKKVIERSFDNKAHYADGYNTQMKYPFISGVWYNLVTTYVGSTKVAKAYVNDLWAGRYSPLDRVTAFPSDGYDGIVQESRIPVISMCSHHHQQIRGEVSIAYIASENGKVVGLSKLNRIVEQFGRRGAIQEQLTVAIHNAVDKICEGNQGVAVMINATHACVSCRGVKHQGAAMQTAKLTGAFLHEDSAKAEFYKNIELSIRN